METTVRKEIEALRHMTVVQLKQKYAEVFGEETRSHHKHFLFRPPVGHANYFGVIRAARHTQWSTVATREVVNGKSVIENLEFADYDSLADSCRDYARPFVGTELRPASSFRISRSASSQS